jgi:hypothetical protein
MVVRAELCPTAATVTEEHVRRAGTIAGLLACIAYSMLATWNGVLMQSARARAMFAAASLDAALKSSLCQPVGAQRPGTAGDALPASDQPAAPPGDCPVCKGLATCHVFLPVAAELGTFAPTVISMCFGSNDDAGTHGLYIRPRSRGPPAIV